MAEFTLVLRGGYVQMGWKEGTGEKEMVSETGGRARLETRDALLSKEG